MDVTKLRIGDHLLYKGHGFFGTLIKIKTWSPFSHIEIFIGSNLSVASRDGLGVNIYPLRTHNLQCILRPVGEYNILDGLQWFNKVKGQKYDWWGLLRFFAYGKQSLTKQFCSEFATRFDRECGFEPFRKEYDADLVAPGTFYTSSKFSIIGEEDDLEKCVGRCQGCAQCRY